MTDEIDIRSGGLVAVDTASLRRAGTRYVTAAEVGRETAALLQAAASALSAESEPPLRWLAERIRAVQTGMCDIAADTLALAQKLQFTAAVFEYVETRAMIQLAALSGDGESVGRMLRRLAALEAEGVSDRAAEVTADWERSRGSDTVSQLAWTPIIGLPLLLLGAGSVVLLDRLGLGAPGRGQLVGEPVPVRVSELGHATATPPDSLADLARRVPRSGAERVRVEKYVMRDGSRVFAAYVAGTRSGGTDEAWDGESNIQLYTGHRSASFDATLQALRDAGAEPGDSVHTVGYSQGAMVVSRVATDGEFDVKSVITIGSPVQADLSADTLSINLRHTDDPVTDLAVGGMPFPDGADGSFTAERSTDPLWSLRDLTSPLHAHDLGGYIQTAEFLDASDDPRMAATRDLLDHLSTAQSVDVFSYGATR